MTYERFEDLPVWKAGMDLAVRVYVLTEEAAFRGKGDLSDQLRRAALSVSNNIAEGFERGTTAELLMYLYIARGSAGEVRSMMRLCEGLLAMSGLRERVGQLVELCESCSRQLRGWADSLQNSEIKGPRHLNDRVRQEYEGKQKGDVFRKQLEGTMRTTMENWIGKKKDNGPDH